MRLELFSVAVHLRHFILRRHHSVARSSMISIYRFCGTSVNPAFARIDSNLSGSSKVPFFMPFCESNLPSRWRLAGFRASHSGL